MRTLLVIDNYDSFTWNLVQLIASVLPSTPATSIKVVLNDAHTVPELLALAPWRIVISPGPGGPRDAGVSTDIIAQATVPVLGVCLGHQCIASLYGASVLPSGAPVHGKASPIRHTNTGVFAGVSQGFLAARYHSLQIDRATLPPALEVTAWTDDGVVMGLQHRDRPLTGVQFHPESVLTPEGPLIIRNFLGT